MGWEVGGRFKREGKYVYLWLIQVDIWQKPTQYCKAIILLLKIKKIQKKHMERYSMFLGWKNQYCENYYTTKCNLQIYCDPYQITNVIFHRTRTKNFTIHMETQKTLNSQSNLEKEEWSWRNQPSRLTHKQKYRPME